MIACSQKKPPKIFDSKDFSSISIILLLLNWNATSKRLQFHYATYYLPIPHTAQAHWAISQKIDPLMCLTIDQIFYSMSYHNLFKNFSKKRENKTSTYCTNMIWQVLFDKTSCTTILSMLKTISLEGILYTTKSISEQP